MFPGQIAADRFEPVPEFRQPLLALVVRRGDQSKQRKLNLLLFGVWFAT